MGRTSIALNFSHHLNLNLVIFSITQKAEQELKVLFISVFNVCAIKCICLVSIWWREYWTRNNWLRFPPKSRSQAKDCWRRLYLDPTKRILFLFWGFCVRALSELTLSHDVIKEDMPLWWTCIFPGAHLCNRIIVSYDLFICLLVKIKIQQRTLSYYLPYSNIPQHRFVLSSKTYLMDCWAHSSAAIFLSCPTRNFSVFIIGTLNKFKLET